LNAIVWKLRTGAPWRDIPDRYGSWKTAHERLRRWSADGTWDRILEHVQVHDDAVGEIEWTFHVDSTIVRAHQHAAGARKPGTAKKGAPRVRASRSLRSRVRRSGGPAAG
jgi:transposase